MNACLLLLTLGLPGTGSAQDPSLVRSQPIGFHAAAEGSEAFADSGSSKPAAERSGTFAQAESPEPASEEERSGESRARRPAGLLPRPRLSGSATGYIDNAIIGSQIRIRFDAGFGEEDPDRAEFFYAKCGCYREVGVDPDAPGPAPEVHEGDDIANMQIIETGLDYQELRLELEYALHPRFSLFGMLPVRSIQPEVNDDATGLGDVQGGFKLGLVATPDQALTIQLRSYANTGDAKEGLGTDHWSLEPALLYHGAFTERMAGAAEFGAWLPIEGSTARGVAPAADSSDSFAGNVLRFGVGASYDALSRPDLRLTPIVELVGWHVLDGYVTRAPDGTVQSASMDRAAGTKILNLKLGGRLTLKERSSFYLGYGHALTERAWYDDVLRMEYRYAF